MNLLFSASHRVPEYTFKEEPIQVREYTLPDGQAPLYFAVHPVLGCGKNAHSPAQAIVILAADHACSMVSVKMPWVEYSGVAVRFDLDFRAKPRRCEKKDGSLAKYTAHGEARDNETGKVYGFEVLEDYARNLDTILWLNGRLIRENHKRGVRFVVRSAYEAFFRADLLRATYEGADLYRANEAARTLNAFTAASLPYRTVDASWDSDCVQDGESASEAVQEASGTVQDGESASEAVQVQETRGKVLRARYAGSPLHSAFRFHLQEFQQSKKLYPDYSGNRALLSVVHARRDLELGKLRYVQPGPGHYNAPFHVGSDLCRWIEKPSEAGLRFVGYADSIVKLEYACWYPNAFQDSAVRGVVFQIPARNGVPTFVAGYDNADNAAADSDGPCAVSFSTLFQDEPAADRWDYRDAASSDAAKDAARSADQLAEWSAESERNHEAAWQAGQRWSELKADLDRSRSKIAAAKRAFSNAESEADRDAMHAIVTDLEEEITNLEGEMETLQEGDDFAFPFDSKFKDAFNEGAEEAA